MFFLKVDDVLYRSIPFTLPFCVKTNSIISDKSIWSNWTWQETITAGFAHILLLTNQDKIFLDKTIWFEHGSVTSRRLRKLWQTDRPNSRPTDRPTNRRPHGHTSNGQVCWLSNSHTNKVCSGAIKFLTPFLDAGSLLFVRSYKFLGSL